MNKTDTLKNMLQNGIVTATAMKKENIPSSIISILIKRGEAKRLARGVYASSEAGFSDMSDYEALAANTDGIFCLISALRLHGLTDENPHDLCMAIKRGYHPHSTAIFPSQSFTGQEFFQTLSKFVIPMVWLCVSTR